MKKLPLYFQRSS